MPGGHKISQNVEFGCEVGEGGREYIFDKNLIEVAVARRVPGIYVVLSLARPVTNVFGGLEKNGAFMLALHDLRDSELIHDYEHGQ